MTLTDLLRKMCSPARVLALGAAMYGCGGTSESPYDGSSGSNPYDGSSGNKDPPVTKECRDVAPYLDIELSTKDGSYSFQEHFENPPLRWQCRSGANDKHGFGFIGEYQVEGDYANPGVYIEASEDYRGPGSYDISRAQLGIPGVDLSDERSRIYFRNGKGVTSLDALLVREGVGRRCVSGAVELYLQDQTNEVPGTLEFEGVCGEFVNF